MTDKEDDCKPCPFCGGCADEESISYDDDEETGTIRVACSCGACGPAEPFSYAGDDNERATEVSQQRWNARPLEAAKDAKIPELEKALAELCPRWIPVTESLPNLKREIWAYGPEVEVAKGWRCGPEAPYDWTLGYGAYYNGEISHWMYRKDDRPTKQEEHLGS